MKIEKRHTDWIEISHGLYSLEIFTGPQWLFGNWFKDWNIGGSIYHLPILRSSLPKPRFDMKIVTPSPVERRNEK